LRSDDERETREEEDLGKKKEGRREEGKKVSLGCPLLPSELNSERVELEECVFLEG